MSDPLMLRPFEQERINRLVELAQSQFDAALTLPEMRVLMHSAAATELSLPSNDEPRPPVRSTFLRWLMTDVDASKFIDPKGIRIWSVSISDQLDLQGCKIPYPLQFLSISFEAELLLINAVVRGLFFFGTTFDAGLFCDGVEIQGPLFIKESRCDGTARFVGARIEGNVGLRGTEFRGSSITLTFEGAKISGSAFMNDGFRSSGEVRMLNTRIEGDLSFDGATLTATGRALSLDKLVVGGNVSLSKWPDPYGSFSVFHSEGLVGLSGAQIGGNLDCEAAELAGTGKALDLSTAQIRGHVYLRHGFKSRGEIHMHSVNVGNSVDFSGAVLTDARFAILLQDATVRSTIYISEGFASFGGVDVQGARIEGNLVCDDCKLLFLYCANMTLKGDLQWTGIHDAKATSLCLNGATIKNLRDERESWPMPGSLRLDGLVYEELTLHSPRSELSRQKNELGAEHPVNIKNRLEWLKLQTGPDQAEPQPWMQLAALFREKGDDDGAKRIIFQLRCAQAHPANLATRTWKITFAKLQQQPLWVLAPIVLITSLATSVFWVASLRGAIAPTSREAYAAWSNGSRMDAAYPRFNPLIYSLENDVPLLRFGLDDKWAPDPIYKPKGWFISYNTLRWTRVFLVLIGWIQATLLATAIGSRFKS